MITCKTCQISQPEDRFLVRKGRIFKTRCRKCNGQYQNRKLRERAEAGGEAAFLTLNLRSKIISIKKKHPETMLTIADLREMFFQQNKVCAMSGLPFRMVRDGRYTWNSISVDRIIPGGPYSKENCRLILNAVNSMRGIEDDEVVYRLAEALVKYRASLPS